MYWEFCKFISTCVSLLNIIHEFPKSLEIVQCIGYTDTQGSVTLNVENFAQLCLVIVYSCIRFRT